MVGIADPVVALVVDEALALRLAEREAESSEDKQLPAGMTYSQESDYEDTDELRELLETASSVPLEDRLAATAASVTS